MSKSPPFRRVLIANRGEIAVRICRALRELGIESIAVHSEVDRRSAHVLAADHAFPLGGNTAQESYLDVGKILAAAKALDAQAIHPGYGFLSENAAFARAVRAAGMTFLGPKPDAMDRLGSKKAAREEAIKAGVAVVPGTEQDDGDAALAAAARRIGLPVMVKASAGGGGRGMRLVERDGELAEAIAASRREAKAAFGDDRMIVEKAVFPARHVEIQLIGDKHGDVVSLHERECSVQRRHQKVLEESPSPAVDETLRRRMGEAAIKLAKAVGYDNAGTAEFLLDERGTFYFLEVNTRLQVEHPVTELVTGVDLVHLQVRVAAGEKLSDLLRGLDLRPRGHAMEVRICAEAPEQGFLPAAGQLRLVREPEGPGIRVDSGVYSGWEVPVHYDSLLAKLIVHAPDRATACERMTQALRAAVYLGIPTNVDFLRRLVDDPDFRQGRLRTDFLQRKPGLGRGTDVPPDDLVLAAAVLCQAMSPRAATAAGTGPVGGDGAGGAAPRSTAVWRDLAGLRLFGNSSGGEK
jgi:acetyl-CoA carboxylase biotin carboxylase subunit